MSEADRQERSASRRMLYEMAQVFDRRDYEEGSTLRGALKGWRKLGVAADANWPYDPDDEHGEKHGRLTLPRVVDAVARPGGFYFRILPDDIRNMQDALARGCPLYVSAWIHTGWYRLFLADSGAAIQWRDDDKVLGRHACVIVGYDEVGFWIHNSWGGQWAVDGYARITYDDWMEFGDQVWVVVPPPPPERTVVSDPTPPAPATAADRERSFHEMWRHVICLGDDGRLSSLAGYAPDSDAVGTLLYLFQEETKDWDRRRLAVFADGGYWPTANTVEFLRPLRARLMEAGIYPIFLVWESAWYAETRSWLLGERGLAGADGLERDELDEFWEGNGGPTMAKVLAAESVAPRVWDELATRSAAAVRRDDGGARHLADSLHYKWGQKPFDVHLISHGVGDMLLTEFVQLLEMPVASCQLWAPATRIDRAHAVYTPRLADGRIGHVSVAALDDESERADRVGPMPGSALLLASDVLALDDKDLDRVLDLADDRDDGVAPRWAVPREPLLGLAGDLDADAVCRRLADAGLLDAATFGGVTHTRLVASGTVHQASIESMITHPSAAPPAPRPPEDPLRAAGRGDSSAPVSLGGAVVSPRRDPLAAAAITDPLVSVEVSDPLVAAEISDPLRRAEASTGP
jgi:hypothetical protein